MHIQQNSASSTTSGHVLEYGGEKKQLHNTHTIRYHFTYRDNKGHNVEEGETMIISQWNKFRFGERHKDGLGRCHSGEKHTGDTLFPILNVGSKGVHSFNMPHSFIFIMHTLFFLKSYILTSEYIQIQYNKPGKINNKGITGWSKWVEHSLVP